MDDVIGKPEPLEQIPEIRLAQCNPLYFTHISVNPDHNNDYQMLRDEYDKVKLALRNLVKACPSQLRCDDFHHNNKDYHGGTDVSCPPVQRYNRALEEASELLGGQ